MRRPLTTDSSSFWTKKREQILNPSFRLGSPTLIRKSESNLDALNDFRKILKVFQIFLVSNDQEMRISFIEKFDLVPRILTLIKNEES